MKKFISRSELAVLSQTTPGHNNKIIVYNLPWEIVLLDIFNKYREVLSSQEAFLGWKQSEGGTPHMPVSSSQSTNDKELYRHPLLYHHSAQVSSIPSSQEQCTCLSSVGVKMVEPKVIISHFGRQRINARQQLGDHKLKVGRYSQPLLTWNHSVLLACLN